MTLRLGAPAPGGERDSDTEPPPQEDGVVGLAELEPKLSDGGNEEPQAASGR
ncbi:MAG: hypothetical protein GY784_18540 [Gammaproteobacteria bacterium]|nr:hypothetical protein [Gammaproteobacteria bacterium]